MPFDLDEFSQALINGELDNKLPQLKEVIRLRESINGQLKAIELKPKDRVRFTDEVRPEYLRGLEGTIRERKTKRFVVDLDERAGRFFKGILVYPRHIEKIEQ